MCREVTRQRKGLQAVGVANLDGKYMGETNGRQGTSIRFVSIDFSVLFLVTRLVSSPRYSLAGGGEHLHREI